jgi:hypothetical protein
LFEYTSVLASYRAASAEPEGVTFADGKCIVMVNSSRPHPVRTKGSNVTVSTILLLLATLGVWLLAAATGIQVPPGPGPWYSYLVNIFALALLPVVSWAAARFWYWFPAFFGFGVFVVFPSAWFICGSQIYGFRIYSNPTHPMLTTFAFCCAAGFLAAFIGWVSSRALYVKNRNAQSA